MKGLRFPNDIIDPSPDWPKTIKNAVCLERGGSAVGGETGAVTLGKYKLRVSWTGWDVGP